MQFNKAKKKKSMNFNLMIHDGKRFFFCNKIKQTI